MHRPCASHARTVGLSQGVGNGGRPFRTRLWSLNRAYDHARCAQINFGWGTCPCLLAFNTENIAKVCIAVPLPARAAQLQQNASAHQQRCCCMSWWR
eukprot:158243-Pelagomonas_calceolata.AAC.2